MKRTPLVLVALSLFWMPAGAWAQQAAEPAAREKPAARSKTPRKVRRDPPGTYMGRPIAPVMSFMGADWLVRATRVQEEQPEQMLDALKIPEGATVADIGAGVGYTSLLLSRRVGPRGTVLATDLQPEMLEMLASNMREAGVKNVRPIRCTANDPKLPEGKVDLTIMVDVYHECTNPEATLQGIRKALKPRGRLVLVEFRAEDPDVPIRPEHKMTLKQVRREVEPQGFTFKESLEFLPWQHIIIFEKPGEGAKKDGAPAKSESKK
jgi:ubiquinone/menaquinone biosynthesis C-methylase UbiE